MTGIKVSSPGPAEPRPLLGAQLGIFEVLRPAAALHPARLGGDKYRGYPLQDRAPLFLREDRQDADRHPINRPASTRNGNAGTTTLAARVLSCARAGSSGHQVPRGLTR